MNFIRILILGISLTLLTACKTEDPSQNYNNVFYNKGQASSIDDEFVDLLENTLNNIVDEYNLIIQNSDVESIMKSGTMVDINYKETKKLKINGIKEVELKRLFIVIESETRIPNGTVVTLDKEDKYTSYIILADNEYLNKIYEKLDI